MTKDFWINLPVKDIARSRAFFSRLGFSFNSKYPENDQSAALMVGDNEVVVMLFAEPDHLTIGCPLEPCPSVRE